MIFQQQHQNLFKFLALLKIVSPHYRLKRMPVFRREGFRALGRSGLGHSAAGSGSGDDSGTRTARHIRCLKAFGETVFKFLAWLGYEVGAVSIAVKLILEERR